MAALKCTRMPIIAAHVADNGTMIGRLSPLTLPSNQKLLLQVDIVPREERGDEGLSSRPSQPGMPAAGMNQSMPSAWPLHLPTSDLLLRVIACCGSMKRCAFWSSADASYNTVDTM